jgi:hypothetical protein
MWGFDGAPAAPTILLAQDFAMDSARISAIIV